MPCGPRWHVGTLGWFFLPVFCIQSFKPLLLSTCPNVNQSLKCVCFQGDLLPHSHLLEHCIRNLCNVTVHSRMTRLCQHRARLTHLPGKGMAFIAAPLPPPTLTICHRPMLICFLQATQFIILQFLLSWGFLFLLSSTNTPRTSCWFSQPPKS